MLLATTLPQGCSPKDETTAENIATPKWQQESQRKLYSVTIEPRNGTIPIGEYHQWVISLRDSANRPVTLAQIAMAGGMPAHGHGLPSQPQVTEHLGGGIYLIEGVRFNMAGAWTLDFRLSSPAGPDEVQFYIELKF